MIAKESVERMERGKLDALKFSRLKKILAWVMEKSRFYQQKYTQAKVDIAEIKNLEDISKLPFLRPEELRRADSLDVLTLPFSGISRFNYMEEMTGEITRFYTAGDIRGNVEMLVRGLRAADITRASVAGIQGDMSDSRFLDILTALEAIGATTVPLGTDYRHWLRIVELLGMDTLISTPQLVMQLTIQLQATGKNIVDYPISKVVCVNTNTIQNPLRQHIADRTCAKVYNLFAPPELGTAGMLFECGASRGQHVQEDFFLAEIVEFDRDKTIEEETRMGELVVTTLAAEAMPLIRYRTGQAVSIIKDSCPCGRTFMRVGTPFSFV